MHNPFHSFSRFSIGVTAALIGISVAVGLLSWEMHTKLLSLERNIEELTQVTTQNTATLERKTTALERNLSETRENITGTLTREQQRVAELSGEVGGLKDRSDQIAGTVGTLEKLSRTDEELLQKYSKVFFLNEHYAPDDVVEIPDAYKYHEWRNHTLHTQVYPYLESLLEAAADSGVELYVFSAYRPFAEQAALKEQYTVTYGAGTANQFSADQGYSEHQLGTAVDLITTGIDGTLSGFGETDAYRWLRNNAHRYGFTLSYPDGNAHYVFEPWHWRFVGVALATELHDTNRYFYDLDQRTIDEYRVNIFD